MFKRVQGVNAGIFFDPLLLLGQTRFMHRVGDQSFVLLFDYILGFVTE